MVKKINEALHEKGQALRAKILGSGRVAEAVAQADDFIEYYHIIGHECAYGLLWSRPELSLANRSLVTVATLATMGGSGDVLRAHIKGAITNACSRQELAGLMSVVVAYLGAGVGRATIEEARLAFSQLDQQQAVVSPVEVSSRGASSSEASKGVSMVLEAAGLSQGVVAGKAGLDEMTRDYYNRYLWADGKLSAKSRLFVVLAILASANRLRDLALHIRAAVDCGCTREEIAEVFLTVLIYAGLPACLDGFRTAAEVYAVLDK